MDLYGDFSQEEPSDLDALEASLRSPPENTSPANDSTDAEIVEETPTSSPQSNFSWNTGITASPTFTDASSVDLHAKYLALCVNTGGMYKKLAEIDTSRIKSDSEVFSQMKKAYLEHRGLRSRLSFLIKPVTVEFVRVSPGFPFHTATCLGIMRQVPTTYHKIEQIRSHQPEYCGKYL